MIPTLSDVSNLPNRTQTFRWYLSFPTPPPAIAYPGDEALNRRCESITQPKKDPTATELVIRGHKTAQPGIATYTNTITLTFIETVDYIVSRYLYDWKNACWSDDDTDSGLSLDNVELKGIGLLTRLDNKNRPVALTTLFNCFPQETDPGGDLSAESADPFKPTVTLWFDHFKEEYVTR